ncbi:hypothetical protein [Shewanella baltica]|nr:hypothetical protein [Shewanella baltica]MCS6211590.1 hypothetical protein [Shewanella baltica]
MNKTRRKIAFGMLTVPALTAMTTLTGCNDSDNNKISTEEISNEDFNQIIRQKLSRELNDDLTAEQLIPFIAEASFNMTPVTHSIEKADVLIGFAFGNRPNESGDPNELAQPGPMNEALAASCAEIYRKKPMTMYVQWEIARFLDSVRYPDIPAKDIVSIEPYWDDKGTLIYLSTDGVVQTIVNQHFHGDPTTVGSAVVVAHRDHVKRCITTCKMRNIIGFASQEITLPNWYDEKSHQPWTRRRALYVLQDISAQMMMMAQTNIIQAYPNK